VAEADFRIAAVEIVNAGVRNIEENLATVGEALADQIRDDLFLIIDEHPLADQLVKVDVARLALERDIDAVVHHRLALQTRANAGVDQHLRDPVLHQTGAHPRLTIGAAPILDHDAGNAGEMQQMRQHQPGRSRPHDADLRPHGCSLVFRKNARRSRRVQGMEAGIFGPFGGPMRLCGTNPQAASCDAPRPMLGTNQKQIHPGETI
jgi:hypothetical protein